MELIAFEPGLLLWSLFLILDIIAIISILNNNFEIKTKVAWILVVLFIPFAGVVLYFFIGKRSIKPN